MNKLSSRERLLRVFRREPLDRMPIRLWGVDPAQRSARPSYAPLYDMVEEYELDIIRNWRPSAEESDPPAYVARSERRDADSADMWVTHRTVETPAGPLTSEHYSFKDGRPGYVKKHLIETVADAKRWLSIPSPEPQFRCDSYWDAARQAGDRAMMMVGIGHAMYGVQAHMGSETFGFWLVEERDLLHEMIDKSFRAVEVAVKRYIAHGVGDCYGWVGPELCIPPLASPRDFMEFVFDYDKRIIELVHDAGKLVWVHSHGDMEPVLEGFADMGVDCLNPMEPPPVGSITLAQAKARVGDRMTLEGGVQNGDFDTLEPHEMQRVVEETVAQGKPGGGFILCPTSGPSTWNELTPRHIENHRVFVQTAMRLAEYD